MILVESPRKFGISKLSQIIQGFPGELATTQEGKAWVTKALHPADAITECRGIPDESACPSAILTYNTVYRITPPVGETSWGFDVSIIPNAISQAFVRVLTAADGISSQYNFLNQQLTPPGVVSPTYAQLLAQFRSLGIEAHRLVYMGVTAYQDGPALADQGTIVAAQWDVARLKYGTVLTDTTPTGIGYGTRRTVGYTENDYARYATSQYLPNAYFSQSKSGCYLPIRLSGNEKWVTDADLEMFTNPLVGPGTFNDGLVTFPTAAAAGIPPFPSLVRPWFSPGAETLNGDSVFKPLNSVWGAISARNLSNQTSFAFYIRMAIECRVSPTSVYASQVRMSPMYDPVAMASYWRISRELKDAYPADYNDLGKIWDVIKRAAKMVLPVTSMLGPTGAAISGGVGAAVDLIDSIRKKPSSAPASGLRGEANPPPAAALDRVRKAIAAAPVKRDTRKIKVSRK